MTRIKTIDLHTAGEPLRVITGGYPLPEGQTILERRRDARDRLDVWRRRVMFEPRGHADMYGALVVPPETADADIGVLFLHNEGYSTMCGHGIIALVTAGLDHGLFAVRDRTTIRIDTPAGRVVARAHGEERVERVSFRNVPSFVAATDVAVDAGELGVVRGDVAFGGAFYFYVDAVALGLPLDAAHAAQLIDTGKRLKRAFLQQHSVAHPSGDADLEFLYGVIFVGPSEHAHSRNVCVFADGELDRSPTGTGVSGRAAILYARGELGVGDAITIESVLGTTFDVAVVETVDVAGRAAIVPEVTGSAHVTGFCEFVVDPEDPLADGFLVR